MKNSFLKKKKTGMTLMEIMVALLIFALTFLPLIAVMGSFTKDSDAMNSYIFAQTTARNILDTLLDEVPFNSIQGNAEEAAKLIDYGNKYKISSFKDLIGTKNDLASGTVTDERGIEYNITLYCYPIPVTQGTGVDEQNEMVFSYKERPPFEKEDNFYSFTNLDESCFLKTQSPYAMADNCQEINPSAYQLGAKKNYSINEYYVMKKIVLHIEWTSRDGRKREFGIFTMKANLDSEKGI